MFKKEVFRLKKSKAFGLCSVALATLVVCGSIVSAESWKANSWENISIVKGQETYVVKAGDTLWGISKKAGMKLKDLAELNNIDLVKGEERKLRIGQVLKLVGSSNKVVESSFIENNVLSIKEFQLPKQIIDEVKSVVQSSWVDFDINSVPIKSDINKSDTNNSDTNNSDTAKSDKVVVVVDDDKTLKITESNVVYHIKTQSDLEAYLEKTGHNLTGDEVYFENGISLVFPKSVYYVNGNNGILNWYLTSKSVGNIDFSNSIFVLGNNTQFNLQTTANHRNTGGNQVLSNLVVYGSVVESIDESGNIVRPDNWVNGNFNADILHAQNLTFKNMIFNNAQQSNDHIFDVMGSKNIVFDGITVNGYGGQKLNSEDILKLYKANPHTVLAEAIQVDASNYGASGHLDLSSSKLWNNSMNDGKSSENIEIKNSKFSSYKGVSGQSIIDGKSDIVERNVGSTVGGHSVGSDSYKDISIHDNTFEDTIGVSSVDSTEIYPIHLKTTNTDESSELKVYSNTFINQTGLYTDSGVEVDGVTGFYGDGSSNNTTSTLGESSNVDYASDVVNEMKEIISSEKE